MPRPSVDVVVPFRGDRAHVEELLNRLSGLRLRPGDSVVVVDNTPGREPDDASVAERSASVLHAAERATPAFARNRGAALGTADWLVFFDADTVPPPDLLDRYFEPLPAERTALLGGGVLDEAEAGRPGAIARYQQLRGSMSQEDTYRYGKTWGYPKTANLACRRTAFEAVGGFREEIRAAEDGDLTFRLRDEGWEFERRDRAVVVHLSRKTIHAFVAQKLMHGAGGAWLDRQYPGTWPARALPGLIWWALRTASAGLLAAVWERNRDRAIWALLDPLDLIAWELGRSLPNERPVPGQRRASWLVERLP